WSYTVQSLPPSTIHPTWQTFFFFLLIRRPPGSPLFPYTTLFRSWRQVAGELGSFVLDALARGPVMQRLLVSNAQAHLDLATCRQDRKSTRLNSSHVAISYAVFCLKKKKTKKQSITSQRKHE